MSFRSRVAVTAAIGVAWVLLLAYWLLTYASDYDWWVNLGVLVIFLIAGSVMNRFIWPEDAPRPVEGSREGLMPRVVISVVAAVFWLAAVVAWWLLYSGDHGTYVALAYVLLSTLPLGAIMLVNWMTWLH